MNYYNEIKRKLINDEIYSKVKDYSKERNKVITYYEIGKLLNEVGKEYGKNIIKKYSEKLVIEVGKKYNERTLYGMRKFYEVFSSEKLNPLGSKLSWSHYRELLSVKDVDAIRYYIDICIKNNLSKRDLQTKIKNHEYDRLSEEVKVKLKTKENFEVSDFIKSPIVIRNNNNCEVISERILQKLILENIEEFMMELGDSFSFISSEYKIKLGDRYNYIDLLLYNIEFNCYVVVELKVTELKKEHIGQIQVYMNYIDNNLRKITQDKTIGIIICRDDNSYVIKYCFDDRIIAREYELI